MHVPAHPLPRLALWQCPLRLNAAVVLVFALLTLLLATLMPHSAAARATLPRDRRSDREIAVTYARIQPQRRPTSGFAPRDRRESSPPATNSGESEQSPSNKNDEQGPVRDTNLRLAR